MPRKARTPIRTPTRRRAGTDGSVRASGYPVYTPAELAEMLGLTTDTLRKWRTAGKGPAFVRETRRSCVYRKSAVDEWLAQAEQHVQIVEPRRKKKPNNTPSQESADVTT